ncbi:hypothetical protein LINPERPRIM_LOCUS38519 [Linum perenne]
MLNYQSRAARYCYEAQVGVGCWISIGLRAI